MMFQGPKGYIARTPVVWKQYNKMAVLHFFLVNSPLIYILFSLGLQVTIDKLKKPSKS